MTDGQRAYREFLRSEFWQNLSVSVRRKAGKCKRCGRRDSLQAHHHRYPKNWYETRESDLVVLCRGCHRKAHGLGREYASHFPYRKDRKFNAIMSRIGHLHRRIQRGGFLRVRDERFLDDATRRYPRLPDDGCMEFQVGLLRQMNLFMKDLQNGQMGTDI